NTSITGYQEILTDPSYSGQIITMTYPLIGNYGINPDDFEGERPYARGLIVREFCTQPSNWRSRETLDAFMKKYGLMGLASIDTRALTRKLRASGSMKGLLTTSVVALPELVEKVRALPGLGEEDHVQKTSIKQISVLPGNGPSVAILDLGAMNKIGKLLQETGCAVTIYPASTRAEEILSAKHRGLLISNGPGDPKRVPYVVETVRQLLGKLPLFGIGLGHEVVGLALGGDTYKLKFGHHGANYPVRDLTTGRIHITCQNHTFAIREESLNKDMVKVTHRNVNDGTVEGLRHKELPVFTIQYRAEAAPAFDSLPLFTDFLSLL
ncbi:MAG TPA: glutamine-hydrolyzing carbamoyl-phosphate synthase small subunit, partial [Firmicutes bacterium]|nr:glutamine-hydrolyzing carbamoyl-phosphate synthase small subunit [Bacillota bacterium]